MNKSNYSVDMMKKMAYTHEINNYLKLRIQKLQDEDPFFNMREIDDLLKVLYFFENRIKELDRLNK